MTNKKEQKKYKYQDIFKKNSEGETNMVLPPELIEAMDLKPGDNLKILAGDQGTIILEKIDGKE